MGRFINPYNFVPLAKTPPLRSAEGKEATEKLYTGKIQYKMETLSPLFIPNTSNDRILGVTGVEDSENAYHKSYDFFSYHDLSGETDAKEYYEPIIPGSEIRGMVRSVYEALTNSCLSAVDENVTLSKRTAEHFEAGVLLKKGDGYELCPAKDYLFRVNGRADFSRHSYMEKDLPADGSHVYFAVDTKSAPDRSNYAKPLACKISLNGKQGQQRKGFLMKGEPGPDLAKSRGSKCDDCPEITKEKCRKNQEKNCYLLEKHCAHVFAIDPKRECEKRVMRKAEAEEVSRRMDALLEIYGNNRDRKGMYSEYRETWEKFKKGLAEGIAVYYSVAGNICYLSPACITREVYKNTLGNILGEYRACDDPDKACPACRLFGAINSRLRIASKLRFADAYIAEKREKNKDYYEKQITLPELSAPKLSSTEFYLRRPDDKGVMNWTYDYYVRLEDGNHVSVRTYKPQIAGRKFYWHSPETADWVCRKEVQSKIEKNERNKTVRPLKERVVFRGELYFDGITKSQLDALIFILNISALDEPQKYALKIGNAKPLGFGSVALTVEHVAFRTVSWDEGAGIMYTVDTSDDYHIIEKPEEMSAAFNKEILKILDTKALQGKRMHYPFVNEEKMETGEEEGFKWFTENRKGKQYKRGELNLERGDQAPKSRNQVIYQEYMQPLAQNLMRNRTGESERGRS